MIDLNSRHFSSCNTGGDLKEIRRPLGIFKTETEDKDELRMLKSQLSIDRSDGQCQGHAVEIKVQDTIEKVISLQKALEGQDGSMQTELNVMNEDIGLIYRRQSTTMRQTDSLKTRKNIIHSFETNKGDIDRQVDSQGRLKQLVSSQETLQFARKSDSQDSRYDSLTNEPSTEQEYKERWRNNLPRNDNSCSKESGRYKDIDGDLYTLSWSRYPRVEIFLEYTDSIYERFEKQMDRFIALIQSQRQRDQYFPSKDSVDAMKKVPKIVIVGDLRKTITVRNIACNTMQLRDNERKETVSLSNWSQYYHPEDPVVLLFTAVIHTEDDFSRCISDFSDILDGPFQRLLFVIETDKQIDRQGKQFTQFNSSINQLVEKYSKQETKHNISILHNQLETQDVSKNISEFLELGVVNLLSFIETILHNNMFEKVIVSHISFARPEFIQNIKIAVTGLFYDSVVAGALLNEIQMKEIITKDQLRVVRKELVNELSCSTDMEPETINRFLDLVNFEQQCKAGIKDKTSNNIMEFLRAALIEYPCKHPRDQEETMFWEHFNHAHHSNCVDELVADLTGIIEDTAIKLLGIELRKSFEIQQKLHFEVVSLLKRTVEKDKFESSLPSVELPSSDLFGIEEVEGLGIIYNKLQVHIKLKKPEDEENVCKQIKAKLSNYRHPYKICCIVNKAEPLYYVGGKLIAQSENSKNQVRYGTIGALMRDRAGKLHILTCRHVVNLVRGRAEDLCFHDGISVGSAICVPDPNKMNPTEIRFFDIAAVEVKVELRDNCERDFKRPDGSTGPSSILNDPGRNINGLPVYKWGASTKLTKGIIVSGSYRERKLLPLGQSHVLIESKPGATDCVFAEKGDSGATVCALDPSVPDKISVIAMISGGELELRDAGVEADAEEETQKVLAFHISDGIKCLNRSLPDPIDI